MNKTFIAAVLKCGVCAATLLLFALAILAALLASFPKLALQATAVAAISFSVNFLRV